MLPRTAAGCAVAATACRTTPIVSGSQRSLQMRWVVPRHCRLSLPSLINDGGGAWAQQADGVHAASKATLPQHRRMHRMSPPAQRPQDVQRDASWRRPADHAAGGMCNRLLAQCSLAGLEARCDLTALLSIPAAEQTQRSTVAPEQLRVVLPQVVVKHGLQLDLDAGQEQEVRWMPVRAFCSAPSHFQRAALASHTCMHAPCNSDRLSDPALRIPEPHARQTSTPAAPCAADPPASCCPATAAGLQVVEPTRGLYGFAPKGNFGLHCCNAVLCIEAPAMCTQSPQHHRSSCSAHLWKSPWRLAAHRVPGERPAAAARSSLPPARSECMWDGSQAMAGILSCSSHLRPMPC